jgi:hypothetical protein
MTRLAHSSDPGADNRGIEERTVFRLPMKLCSGLEGGVGPGAKRARLPGQIAPYSKTAFSRRPSRR